MNMTLAIRGKGPTLVRHIIVGSQILVGASLVAFGAVLTVTPIPFGLPLMAGGFVLLTSCSHTCRKCAAHLRRRLSLLDAALIRVENNTPVVFARLLRQTNPRYACAVMVPVHGAFQ